METRWLYMLLLCGGPSWGPFQLRMGLTMLKNCLLARAVSAIGIASLLASCNSGGQRGNATDTVPYLPQDLRSAQSLPGNDGRIAFVQFPPDATGPDADIYTINPDGSQVRRLTHLAAHGNGAYYPHWSPDGKQIIFDLCTGGCNNPEGTRIVIGIVRADGMGQHVLYADPNANIQNTSFSPDGKHIVFSRCFVAGPIGCEIARINDDGTGLVMLTRPNPIGDTIDLNPAYSPDGRIVFDGLDRGGYLDRLYVMNSDGSNMHPVSPPALGGTNADWSRDGRRLVFSTYPHFNGFGANEEIWARGGDVDSFEQLTHNNDNLAVSYFAANHDYAPSWSPRGDAVVFERDNGDFTKFSLELIRFNGTGLEQTLLTLTPLRVSRQSGIITRGLPATQRIRTTARLFETGGMTPSWGSAPPVH